MSTLVLIGALVGDEAVRVAGGAGAARALLLDLELHAAAFVDLRRDLEDRADFLALDGRERIHVAVVVAAGVRELAGEERHFLRDLDLGLLVVERDRDGVAIDVGVAVARERAQHRGEVHAVVARCGRCRT